MKMNRLWWVPVLLLLGPVGPLSVSAGPATTVLRSQGQGPGDAILLAYLLPEDASEKLRQIAETISLGTAPQPGSTRRILGSTVRNAILAGGLVPESFQIPETVDVRRATRMLTREEVYGVLQAFLTANPVKGLPSFGADDISFEASVVVPKDGLRLHVTQFMFDRGLGQARFRLWSSRPLVLPFFVTATVHTPRSALHTAAFALTPDLVVDSSTVLVDPRSRARLHLHSENSEAMLQVQPLRPGHLGEMIPVRLLANRKTLQARVVGPGSLDASF